MVVAEEIEARREEIAGSTDLSAQLERLIEQAQRFLEQRPRIPQWKAQLSSDGSIRKQWPQAYQNTSTTSTFPGPTLVGCAGLSVL